MEATGATTRPPWQSHDNDAGRNMAEFPFPFPGASENRGFLRLARSCTSETARKWSAAPFPGRRQDNCLFANFALCPAQWIRSMKANPVRSAVPSTDGMEWAR